LLNETTTFGGYGLRSRLTNQLRASLLCVYLWSEWNELFKKSELGVMAM